MSITISSPHSIFNKYLVRFVFLYLVMYIYPYGFEYIQELTTDDFSFWEGITIWFGEHVMGWEMNADQLMKGFDSMYDYSRFVLIGLLALIGSCIWLVIDSQIKKDYDLKLKTLTRTILRYHVGLTLIIYGLSKVFMLQFGEMDLNRLEGIPGNTNGMGFLWTFMSYSEFYTRTTGWIEVVGGLLLLFRRTAFLGAFIIFISMITVVLIDIGYDVRVKMFAIHLLLMTILLLLPDLRRIFNFFIFNKPTESSEELSLFEEGRMKKVGYVLKGIILLYFVISNVFIYKERIHNQTANRYTSLTRFHKVETHVVNNDTLSLSDHTRWKSIAINGNSYTPENLQITIGYNPYPKYYTFTADTVAQTIAFKSRNVPDLHSYDMTYKAIGDKKYALEGTSVGGDSIRITTTSKTMDDYMLTANRFRWITDLKIKEEDK